MSGEGITPRSKDFSEWYQDVIREAELSDSSPVRGCIVFRPYGFALWEAMRDDLDRRFRETGHVNAYFPLLIPKSFLSREAEHIEGFAKECAIVTHHRLHAVKDENGTRLEPDPASRLEEELVIRPTSETIIWHMYGRWIQSHRDLPILINQWANVLRWEMRPRAFLRTAEFLWQEGHTAHATKDEAMEEAMRMLNVYREFAEQTLAIPVLPGVKTPGERFPGAVETYTIEAMMQDRKALQAGTSHFLGQNFAKAFDVTFQNEAGEREYVWATSWGVSTRLIGATIMTHSDDTGLVLPPRIAPLPVVIVPIYRKEEERAQVLESAKRIAHDLGRTIRAVRVDDRPNLKPGAKFFEWERKGVPLRMELGPRDLAAGQVTIARRDFQEGASFERKQVCAIDRVHETVDALLSSIQKNLFERAVRFRDAHTKEADSVKTLQRYLEEGAFVRMGWDGSPETEQRLRDELRATIRCIPLDGADPDNRKDPFSGTAAKHTVIAARAY